MTNTKWSDVDRLYHEALTRAPGDRAAFLAEACKGDPELRAEVESLLEYQPHAQQFIETDGSAPPSPVNDAVRRAGAPLAPGRLVGSAVGAYQLEGLGAHLFSRVEGDYFTVLGLPLLAMLAFLREHGVVAE